MCHREKMYERERCGGNIYPLTTSQSADLVNITTPRRACPPKNPLESLSLGRVMAASSIQRPVVPHAAVERLSLLKKQEWQASRASNAAAVLFVVLNPTSRSADSADFCQR
jgi:hypothetical protein